MDLVLLCDFDGTITNIDTAFYLLDRFVKGDWKIFDVQYRKGEITLEECMQEQYSMLKVSEHLMLKELEKVVVFRSNFNRLIDYCRMQNIPFIIASAGLDFVIQHFLRQKDLVNSIKVYSVKTTATEKGIKLTLPKLFYENSNNFKEDIVKYYKKKGNKVVYIGDGTSDYHAIKSSDYRFSVRGSRLAHLCRKNKIAHQEIIDFQEVIDFLEILNV
jgi:2,3-diketo-5-methylthio-1-phosphopentane phosphatase